MQAAEDTNRIGHLVNQVRWVSRLSVALSSALDLNDVYSVLLSGLISPVALGFTEAIVFEVTPTGDEIVGKFAIGIESGEEHAEMRAELEREAEFLERRKRDLLSRASEDDHAAEELRTLEMSASWVTLFQRLGTESELTRKVRALRYPLTSVEDGPPPPQLFRRAAEMHAPAAFGTNGTEPVLPEDLEPLLPLPFAMMALRTSKGLRSVILLSRRLTGKGITRDDLESLDWFATQAAMALQNAELIRDLEGAYSELKAVDQLKSNFLSIISHELRTPLTAITGFVELVLNQRVGGINESQRNLLTRVQKNTVHLNNMVNDLIEIAEIEAEGMTEISLEPVDPLDTLFATLPKLEYRRRDNRVDVEPVFSGEVPQILCDQRALERIYFHLLDNAVKFSSQDEPVVVEFEQRDDGTLAIHICDKGPGIPRDKVQKIFDQFYQVDNSLTRAHEGLGLGLAVTRILVQSTRGEIEVESTLGKGSRFSVIYPVVSPGRDTAMLGIRRR